ncbi:MAG TPA: hypothetical protein PLF16_01570 [Candidatus Staskawiczbacteria bacterium]|nr:hypothetical protein [Candidatus Staskawiczbacteria bacterium]
MKFQNKFLIFFLGLFLAAAGSAKAVCPVCVVAVGGGLGISRWLGVDDAISSLWIGALLAAMSFWTIDWLEKKNWKFAFYKSITWILYYALTVIPLYYYELIGHPLNKIFGIDKILFGVIMGTAVFLGGVWLNDFLKAKNGGKQYFNYQKVVVPFLSLVAASLILYLIIIWK